MLKELFFRNIQTPCVADGVGHFQSPPNLLFFGPGGPPPGGPSGPGGPPPGNGGGPGRFGGFGLPFFFLGSFFGPRPTTGPKNATDDEENIPSSSYFFKLEEQGKMPKWFTNLLDWWDDL